MDDLTYKKLNWKNYTNIQIWRICSWNKTKIRGNSERRVRKSNK
jgi:hypothetical protein